MSARELTFSIHSTEASSDGASPQNYITRWYQNLQTTNSRRNYSLRERLSICELALFSLPEEALEDIKQEMEYKIRFYKELADYDSLQKPDVKTPTLTVKVNEVRIRPPFYLPLDEE